jgi:rubrerythrin
MGLEGIGFNRRRFRDLSEQEVLALAISSEEDDARIYRSYAERLRAEFPTVRQCSTRWRPRRTPTANA